MFIFSVTVLLVSVIALLTLPLWRGSPGSLPLGPEALREQERTDLEIDKQNLLHSLAELELDLAQGKFAQEDYERLKAIDERRLLKVLEKLDRMELERRPSIPTKAAGRPASASARPPTLHWAGSVALSLSVIAFATGIYFYMDWRLQRERAAVREAPADPSMPDPAEMVARLEERLKQNPNDLEGQIMAGRSYMALQRIEDARKAWSKVLEMDSRNQEANFYMGVILLQTAPREDAQSFKRALDYFDIALVRLPREPVLLWYRGVALVHLKRYSEADESWTTAYQNLEPGSEDAQFVKEQLQKLRDGKPPLF